MANLVYIKFECYYYRPVLLDSKESLVPEPSLTSM